MTSRIAFLLAFAVVAAASRRFRARQFDPDLDAPDSASSGGDYMDRYIASSKHGARDSWWSTPSEHQRTSADADVRGSKMDDGVADVHRRSSPWHNAVDSSVSTWHNDMDSSALKDVGRRQPIELDSAMEGVSRSNAQAPPPHGAVVDIKLDSELQTSTKNTGVAKKGLRFIQARARSAPNVETAVAEQQLDDVYIHDEFSKAAESDVEEESSIKDNPELRP